MNITALHEALLKTPLRTPHHILYGEFPGAKGFSSGSPSDNEVEASLLLALAQTPGPGGVLRKVYILTPAAQAARVSAALGQMARGIFGHVRAASPGPARSAVAERVRGMFHHLLLGSRVHLPEAPEHWVAIGFSASDPIPEWVKTGLVSGVLGEDA